MKNFVNALDKSGAGFKYLEEKFPRISASKLKESIFVGPQIRELMKDQLFESQLNHVELEAWISFKNICEQFLGILERTITNN